jgi:hypothetical protein
VLSITLSCSEWNSYCIAAVLYLIAAVLSSLGFINHNSLHLSRSPMMLQHLIILHSHFIVLLYQFQYYQLVDASSHPLSFLIENVHDENRSPRSLTVSHLLIVYQLVSIVYWLTLRHSGEIGSTISFSLT